MEPQYQKLESTVALMGNDLSYVRSDIAEIKASIKDISNIAVTRPEHSEVVSIQKDHEERIRVNTTNITKVMTFGSALIIFVGILEFLVSKFYK